MNGPLSILIVGSNNAEQQALGQAFRRHGVEHRQLSVENKAVFQAYFQKRLADALFVPTLIMVDMDDCQPEPILTLLKGHPVLRRIPVIIYGTGSEPERVKQTYQWGATCYMPKPESWDAALEPFCSYWRKHVALPAIKAEDILSTNPFQNRRNRLA
ncbi:hypothetical protein GCM10027299_12570 [Larkinella ripae]